MLPRLGEQRLSKFDTAHVDEFFNGLERETRALDHDDGATGKQRYSAATRRTIRSIVSGILQQAVLHRAIPANPTAAGRVGQPPGADMLRWPARSTLRTGRARLPVAHRRGPRRAVRLHGRGASRSWTPYWRDPNLGSHLEDRLVPSRRVDELINQVEHDPTGLFWG